MSNELSRFRLGAGTARIVAILAAALLFLVLGCSREESSTPPRQTAPKAEKVVLRLKWLHQAQFAGFYTAATQGFYTKNHMDVDIRPGGIDFPAVQLVANGSADFGVTGADQILLARDKGIPVVAIAVIYRKSPFCYFALQTSGVKTLQDFQGKRVGVKLGGNEELTYRAMLAKAGISSDRVIEVPVKYDMTPLFTGDVVAWPGYSINEPLVAQEQGKAVNYIWPADYGVSLYADTLFTTEKMIRENPDRVRRFVSASLEGWRYAIEHQDAAVAATLKYSEDLTAQHETAMMKASIPHLKPDDQPVGSMERAKWQELHDLLLKSAFLPKPVDVDKAFTTQFLGR